MVNKYLSDFSTVFDPLASYSSHLLGVCASGKKYIGKDYRVSVVAEGNNIINSLDLDAQLELNNAGVSSGRYDCMFTMLPNYNKEIFDSHIELKTCDTWIDTFRFCYPCKKYVFVATDTIKYKKNIVETIVDDDITYYIIVI